MMSKGGKVAQNAMVTKMLEDSSKLSDVKFKKTQDNGNTVFEMTCPDGSKSLLSRPEQVIQNCEELMQMEFVLTQLKEEEKAEEPEKTDKKSEPDVVTNDKFEIQEATESELKEINKIDLEAFQGRYSIKTSFEDNKTDLKNHKIKTYSIKSKNGNVVGYFQLEPIKNGELYIYSIAVEKGLRNTKSSYKALSQMKEEITKIAKEQNVEKVSLDVDANKPELVKLYKKFGFEVAGQESGFEDGHQYTDIHMVADVNKVLGKEKVKQEPVETPEKLEEPIKAPQPEKSEEIKKEI